MCCRIESHETLCSCMLWIIWKYIVITVNCEKDNMRTCQGDIRFLNESNILYSNTSLTLFQRPTVVIFGPCIVVEIMSRTYIYSRWLQLLAVVVQRTHVLFFLSYGLLRVDLNHLILQSLPTWETENKIYCKQTLLDAGGPKTFWTRELRGDELILVSCFKLVQFTLCLFWSYTLDN